MKIKKILLILILPLMLELIVSCCDCVAPTIYSYTNKSIDLKNLDNTGIEPIVSDSNSIAKAAYGIRLTIEKEQIAKSEYMNFHLIQNSYATSCECPPPIQYNPKDSILSIKIMCLSDFDNTHPANSNVSEYFKIYKNHSYTTIQNFIKNSHFILYDKTEFQTTIDFLLVQAPTINSIQKFKIQLYLSDNRVLEKETTSINLQ
jgi:hypothetical protein